MFATDPHNRRDLARITGLCYNETEKESANFENTVMACFGTVIIGLRLLRQAVFSPGIPDAHRGNPLSDACGNSSSRGFRQRGSGRRFNPDRRQSCRSGLHHGENPKFPTPPIKAESHQGWRRISLRYRPIIANKAYKNLNCKIDKSVSVRILKARGMRSCSSRR